jgi:O-antigen ligase
MAFFITTLFMIASYLRPGDLSAELATLRIPFWLGNAGMFAGGAGTVFSRRTSILRSPQLMLLLWFFGVLVMSPILVRGWFGGGADAFTSFSTSIIGYVLIVLSVSDLSKLRVLAALLLVLSLVLVAQGFLATQFGLWRDFFIYNQNVATESEGLQTVDRIRALGYLNDPNDLGQALVSVAPLLWPFWIPRRGFRNFLLIVLPTLLLLYGVYLTHSRGAAFSVVIIVGLLTRERMRRFRNVAPIAAAVVLLAAMSLAGVSGGRDVSTGDESAAGRLDAWSEGFGMLRGNPLFGVGFGGFGEHNTSNHLTAHNSFVLCLGELGLAGYVPWFALLVVAIWELNRVEKATQDVEEYDDLRRWGFAARFSLYAFLSGAFFLSRTYSPTLYVTLAIAFVVVDLARSHTEYEEIPKGQLLWKAGGLAMASVLGLYGVVRVGNVVMH